MEPLDQSWRKFELEDFFYFCGIAADCHKNEKRPKMKPRKRKMHVLWLVGVVGAINFAPTTLSSAIITSTEVVWQSESRS